MTRLILAILGLFVAVSTAFAAVNLNTADEQALASLKGVGIAKARAIVQERERNGPYRSLDDVGARVKGIGPMTVARWKMDGSASTVEAPVQLDAAPGIVR